MHKPVAALLLVASLLHAAPAAAWGFAGHRLIMRRALDLLPAELKPFFDKYREEVIRCGQEFLPFLVELVTKPYQVVVFRSVFFRYVRV